MQVWFDPGSNGNFPPMARFLNLLVAACAFVFASPLAAQTLLQPTSKWNMEYSQSACNAKRLYGDHAISITPAPLGSATRIMIDAPQRSYGSKLTDSIFDSGDGKALFITTSIVYPSSQKGMRSIYTVLPNSEFGRFIETGKLTIASGSGVKAGRLATYAKLPSKYFVAAFDLGPMAALKKALDACMVDLAKHWGMSEGRVSEPPIRTSAQGDVRGLFRAEDIPRGLIRGSINVVSRFLLMIGKNGDVMDCAVVEASGVAALDARGCQVLRERAKFKPALDASGKPTLDTYVTPPIRWIVG